MNNRYVVCNGVQKPIKITWKTKGP